MTSESNIPKESAITEVSPETQALVRQEMAGESDQLQRETMNLIEAIKMKAQSEAQKAGEFTRDEYLKAVRKARVEVENLNLFNKQQVENSVDMMERDAEKNWDQMVKEVTSLGDRLAEAAQAAWDVLTTPRSDRT
ncbi:MAG: hypothetical protein WA919_10100 [Coleofasciculaceae cyanobacterium]